MREIKHIAQAVRDNVQRVIVGKDDEISLLLAALLMGGHALIEDVPGTGKTTLVKAFALSLGADFKRIQFTPDLLPSDITGIKFFNMKTSEFEFIPGPAFANIILADEINRATPKTQAGLLECMEERQITIEGETHPLPAPFMVIATQNPIESMGVFPLPEAQLDRFTLKIGMSYPTREESVGILSRFDKSDPIRQLSPVVSSEEIHAAQRTAGEVFVHPDLFGYIVSIAQATREHAGVVLGISPRGCITLLKVSKCMAAICGRGYVLPDDIKFAAPFVLAHRLVLKASAGLRAGADKEVVKEAVTACPVPSEDFSRYV